MDQNQEQLNQEMEQSTTIEQRNEPHRAELSDEEMVAAKHYYDEMLDDESLRMNACVELAWLGRHPTADPANTAGQMAERIQAWNTLDRDKQVAILRYFKRQLQNFCSTLAMAGYYPQIEVDGHVVEEESRLVISRTMPQG